MQSSWILQGALDWARLILREDARSTAPPRSPSPGPRRWPSAPVDLPRRRQEQQRRWTTARRPERLDQRRAGALQPRQPGRCERQARSRPRGTGAAARRSGCRPTSPRASPPGCATRRPPAPAATATRCCPRTLAQLPTWLGLDAATITRSSPRCDAAADAHAGERQHRGARSARRRDQGLDLAPPNAWCALRQRDPSRHQKPWRRRSPARPLNGQQVSVVSSYFEVRGRLRLDDRVLGAALAGVRSARAGHAGAAARAGVDRRGPAP